MPNQVPEITSLNTQGAKRMVYIDCLRGLAMLMVVYSHILTFSMDRIPPSAIGIFFRDVMLPLFFFISGFCAFKWAEAPIGARPFFRKLWGRTQAILIPTIVMFLLFMLYSGNSPVEFAARYDKSGYWFTWVRFQILLIYQLTELAASRTNNPWIRWIILLSPLLLFSVFSHTIGFQSTAAVVFEWVKIKIYYSFFMAGVALRWFKPWADRMLERPAVNGLLLIMAIGLYVLCGQGITLIFSILVLYYIFLRFDGYLTSSNALIPRLLKVIGHDSLAVYFFHFFLLFNIPVIPEWLTSLQSDICFGTHSCGSVVELAICGALAIAISMLCVWFKRLLVYFPWISALCIGPEKR